MFSQNNQTNTTVMECAQFILPTAMGTNAPSDDLSEDMEGLRLTFPKVKIPGGGVLQFEMESDTPERPDYVPELEGILLPVCGREDRLWQSRRAVRQLRVQHLRQRQQRPGEGV